LLNHGEIATEGNAEDVINSYNFLISKLNEKEEQMSIKEIENSSFGTFNIEIIKVIIKGEESHSNIISSGENANIEISIKSNKNLSNMTIGIVIRDKFGQDIFGTNSFYYHLNINFEKDNNYLCSFHLPLNIGTGKYSITTAIHSQDTHLDNCSHWLDHATDFEIAGVKGNSFVGICRLEPKIKFTTVYTHKPNTL
jgi:lipopolysaccharide transport system ATP-binding protein